MEKRLGNADIHPEAWDFYIAQARNITSEKDIRHLGNYRIPSPDRSGEFIYSRTVDGLWAKFIRRWYEPNINSESVYGKIQGIIEQFK
jgi:hypothetical protein